MRDNKESTECNRAILWSFQLLPYPVSLFLLSNSGYVKIGGKIFKILEIMDWKCTTCLDNVSFCFLRTVWWRLVVNLWLKQCLSSFEHPCKLTKCSFLCFWVLFCCMWLWGKVYSPKTLSVRTQGWTEVYTHVQEILVAAFECSRGVQLCSN